MGFGGILIYDFFSLRLPSLFLSSFIHFLIPLQFLNDGVGEIFGAGLATEVTSESLALGEGSESSLLDAVCILVKAHMSQHHH